MGELPYETVVRQKAEWQRKCWDLEAAIAVYARENIVVEFENDAAAVKYFMDFFESNKV